MLDSPTEAVDSEGRWRLGEDWARGGPMGNRKLLKVILAGLKEERDELDEKDWAMWLVNDDGFTTTGSC